MAKARGASPRRRIRSLGGRIIRRAGLLPEDAADGLGDDQELLGSTLPHTVMVFFADPPGALARLERWYAPLRELDRRHRVVIVLQDSRTARAVRRDARLDVVVVASYTTMDDLLSRSPVKVALYVDDHQENFSNLRFGSMVHARLMCARAGEPRAVTHLVKAYDYVLVPGRAAVERIAALTTFYDARERCMPVGVPPLDRGRRAVGPRDRGPGEPPAVWYVPARQRRQWPDESGTVDRRRHPPGESGTVDRHRIAVVEAFVADGWRVIYRQQAVTGAHGQAPTATDRAIRARLEQRPVRGPRHRVEGAAGARGQDASDALTALTALREADLLLCEEPAAAADWLPVDRPAMLLQHPDVPGGDDDRRIGSLLARAAPADIPRLPLLAREQLRADPQREQRRALVEHYVSDNSPGAATERFLRAIDQLIEIGDRERGRMTGLSENRG